MKIRTILIGIAVAIALLLIAVSLDGCSKTNTVTGPTVYDTITVTKVDTVTVLSENDFYQGLQTWINAQLAPLASYFPAIGTADIIITGTAATAFTFDLYWIAVDFEAGDVYIYAGVFKVTKSGTGFTVEDITPQQMPLRPRTGLATWPGTAKLILVPEK